MVEEAHQEVRLRGPGTSLILPVLVGLCPTGSLSEWAIFMQPEWMHSVMEYPT